MNKDNKNTKDGNTDKKLHISDVIVSKTNKPIKLQLMSLYGTFDKNKNDTFKFY
jgi:hypothetical protein